MVRRNLSDWTTIQIKKSQAEALKRLRKHPKQPLWEILDNVLGVVVGGARRAANLKMEDRTTVVRNVDILI